MNSSLDYEQYEDDGENKYYGYWCHMPDIILLEIFKYFDYKELVNVSFVCKQWNNVSVDDVLWKKLFQKDFKINPSMCPSCKPKTWLSEYRRLSDHIAIVHTENLTEHQHQVLHVSFSHNGKLFATCSKDGYILVWNSNYPATIKYHHDMKCRSWKYTQYSQFNESDTLLLVSGVHFGARHCTSGEIAVFSLENNFELRCRVMNKPYDIFGTWYSDRFLLSGELRWLAQWVSTSLLWLNRASQESESEHVPITNRLYKFYNTNASSIRAIMIANCLPNSEKSLEDKTSGDSDTHSSIRGDSVERGNPPSHSRDMRAVSPAAPQQEVMVNRYPRSSSHRSFDYARPFDYNCDYRKVESLNRRPSKSSSSDYTSSEEEYEENDETPSEPGQVLHDKYLIFTTGSKTYTPHQIGFKRIKPVTFPERLDPGPSLKERLEIRERKKEHGAPEPNWLDYESVADKFDKVDHLIDLHGHIIGMALSPDHRYLYVNSRPWPQGYVIRSPTEPPPIAQEIDIHVIDLVTLRQVGTMLRAHKAYTPNNECFFIFLDVCHDYVASGAEDRFGYLWDRHYGICLAKFPHCDVVNAVAFNPRDPEMLVTTSDDHTIKIWRSRSRARQFGLDMSRLPKAIEVKSERKP